LKPKQTPQDQYPIMLTVMHDINTYMQFDAYDTGKKKQKETEERKKERKKERKEN